MTECVIVNLSDYAGPTPPKINLEIFRQVIAEAHSVGKAVQLRVRLGDFIDGVVNLSNLRGPREYIYLSDHIVYESGPIFKILKSRPGA